MTNIFDAARLDVQDFAQSGGVLSGLVHVGQFERLLQETQGEAAAQAELRWEARGEWRAAAGHGPQPWLHLSVDTRLPLQCQRCLTPVTWPLSVARLFRFVEDEATAMAQDDASDEDLLVQSRSFDLLALLEDELLMALPLVAAHDTCPVALPAWPAAPDEAATPSHPFAVLSQLKRKGGLPHSD